MSGDSTLLIHRRIVVNDCIAFVHLTKSHLRLSRLDTNFLQHHLIAVKPLGFRSVIAAKDRGPFIVEHIYIGQFVGPGH